MCRRDGDTVYQYNGQSGVQCDPTFPGMAVSKGRKFQDNPSIVSFLNCVASELLQMMELCTEQLWAGFMFHFSLHKAKLL